MENKEQMTAKSRFLDQLERRLIRYFMDTKQTKSMKLARKEARSILEGVSVMLDTSSTFLKARELLIDKLV